MKIKIIQTSDSSVYKPLLDITSRINQLYCKKHDYAYESFIGIKRGVHPWHASFNRIYMLYDELTKKKYSWIIYLDADAVFYDFKEKLENIINENDNNLKAIIASVGWHDDTSWDINSGVMFFNLNHKKTFDTIVKWKYTFEEYFTQDVLNKTSVPFSTTLDDQSILHSIFKVDDANNNLDYLKIYKNKEFDRINYNGSFIKQIIRPELGTKGICIEERIKYAKIIEKEINLE